MRKIWSSLSTALRSLSSCRLLSRSLPNGFSTMTRVQPDLHAVFLLGLCCVCAVCRASALFPCCAHPPVGPSMQCGDALLLRRGLAVHTMCWLAMCSATYHVLARYVLPGGTWYQPHRIDGPPGGRALSSTAIWSRGLHLGRGLWWEGGDAL